MVFNKVNDTLRLWCNETARAAREKYRGSAPSSLSYRLPWELAFSLGTLTDVDFPDLEAYRDAVRALLPVKPLPPIHAPNAVERYYMTKTETAFLQKLDSLGPDCEDPGIPYFRVLPADEAFQVRLRLSERWGFEEGFYWFPLSEIEAQGAEVFFLPAHILEPFFPALRKLLDLPAQHMFLLGEPYFDRPNCIETAELDAYRRSERVYTAKDWSWLIVFSHENTVSFAGTIVEPVKELLRDQRAHWNRMEWPE